MSFYYAWLHVVAGLSPCMLNDELAYLHVERNRLLGASYLDIEDPFHFRSSKFSLMVAVFLLVFSQMNVMLPAQVLASFHGLLLLLEDQRN